MCQRWLDLALKVVEVVLKAVEVVLEVVSKVLRGCAEGGRGCAEGGKGCAEGAWRLCRTLEACCGLGDVKAWRYGRRNTSV